VPENSAEKCVGHLALHVDVNKDMKALDLKLQDRHQTGNLSKLLSVSTS
jgi:hypothetical protein